MATVAPFGRWPSPLSAIRAASERTRRAGLASDGTFLYWLESGAADGGRVVCVRAMPGCTPEEVSPPGSDARSRVHGYGGGAFCLVPGAGDREQSLAYVDAADQQVRLGGLGRRAGPKVSSGAADPQPVLGPLALAEVEPVALTLAAPLGARWCHGDLASTPDGSLVLAVRESHTDGGTGHAIVALDPAGARTSVLVEGPGFVAAPRPDSESRRLAWISWRHPEMPWTSSELWVGDLGRGPDGPTIRSPRRVAGGPGLSVGQPTWASDGSLLFACDAAGWWQPWVWREGAPPAQLCPARAEFHDPDWVLGQSTMVPLSDGRVLCRWRSGGVDRLGLVQPGRDEPDTVPQEAVTISAVCAHGSGAAWLGDSAVEASLVWWSPSLSEHGAARAAPRAVVREVTAALGSGDVSFPEPFSFVNRSGKPVHGSFHPPVLGGLTGPESDHPPLVLRCHGGPTGSAGAGFDLAVQFFTSRGFAVADVDYGGSTGHGRSYRERLRGNWGIVDVDDCLDAAEHLAGSGWVDGRRMAIRGSSAGGFTALLALARSDRFAAAVSWYGVSDLLALSATTHDFESHYNDWLVGPLPEAAAEYDDRSPRSQVDHMTGAVLLLHGLDDLVVPVEQATMLAAALRDRGNHCELLTFAGEGHGFRRADTVARCLQAELDLYLDVLVAPFG